MRRWALGCVFVGVAGCVVSGCYASHEVDEAAGPCADSEPPRCVSRTTACDAARPRAAECRDGVWTCPEGSARHAPWRESSCLPLRTQLDPMGDGFPEAPVPVDMDGQCRWLFSLTGESVPTQIAARLGPTCDAVQLDSRESVVDVRDPSTFVGVQAAFTDASEAPFALVRGWRFDPLAPFGVRALGVGFAALRGGRLRVPDRWLFEPELDLGDAAVVFENHLYAYGCPGRPTWIEEDCVVGRAPLASVHERAAWQVWGEEGWGGGAPARVFGSGPHRGPVFVDPRDGALVHIYAVGFGTSLELTRAERPEGPWSPPGRLLPCELPDDDPEAYCAGPVVHLELWDPFSPNTLVVSYGVGTLADDADARRAREPDAYWPRTVHVPF